MKYSLLIISLFGSLPHIAASQHETASPSYTTKALSVLYRTTPSKHLVSMVGRTNTTSKSAEIPISKASKSYDEDDDTTQTETPTETPEKTRLTFKEDELFTKYPHHFSVFLDHFEQ